MMRLAATVEGVIHLEVGEPSFDTLTHIVDAAFADARAGFTRYTPTAGLDSLREAIAVRTTARWKQTVSADEVLVSAGAVSAIAAAIFALAEEGDEVLLPDPGWPNYRSITPLTGATPAFYPLRIEDGYVPDPDLIAACVTPRTKVLLLNTPANPTGAVFPPEIMAGLMRVAQEHDLYVVSDEIYEDLIFEGAHTPAAPFDPERVITVSGFSKTYAMTGWRVGYAIASRPLVELMTKVEEPLISCPSAVSQRAAEAALRGPQEALVGMRDAYRCRRDLVREAFAGTALLPVVPHGAFYAMVDCRALGVPSETLARELLLEERVATAPGATFGPSAEGTLRISLAVADANLIEGCARIRAFVARRTAVPFARDRSLTP